MKSYNRVPGPQHQKGYSSASSIYAHHPWRSEWISTLLTWTRLRPLDPREHPREIKVIKGGSRHGDRFRTWPFDCSADNPLVRSARAEHAQLKWLRDSFHANFDKEEALWPPKVVRAIRQQVKDVGALCRPPSAVIATYAGRSKRQSAYSARAKTLSERALLLDSSQLFFLQASAPLNGQINKSNYVHTDALPLSRYTGDFLLLGLHIGLLI